MTDAMPTPNGLAFNVRAKAKARFSVAVAGPAVALNADWQEWNSNDGHIKGFVRSDRRIELVKISTPGFHLTRANLPVLSAVEKPGTLALRLAAPGPESPRPAIRPTVASSDTWRQGFENNKRWANVRIGTPIVHERIRTHSLFLRNEPLSVPHH